MTRFAFLSLIVFGLHTAGAPAAEDDPKGIDFFEKNIRPVLVANCYQCHSASSKELKGALRLDTKEGIRKGGESGPAVVPGKPDESLLVEALRHESFEMPPNDKLPDHVVANFVKWIELGAPDPRKPNASTVGGKINILEARKFWSFQPPKKTPAPAVKNAAWPASDIDRYILANLEANKLAPVADADRRTLIRRVYFDLIGLPPSPEEIEAFVSDKNPKAFETLVDRLLAMPQFGERWGRHWLDVARYGESTGKERNIPYPVAWKYRDWVYDAFAADKPYDEFIREQVAGDLLPARNDAERNAMQTATGFLALGPKSLNNRNDEQYRMDQVDDQLDVVTRSVMALSVACARCHDHKFDPIPTADYYALAGIFRSTETLAGVKRGNNKTGYTGEYVALTDDSQPRPELSKEDQERLAALTKELDEVQAEARKLRQAAASGGEDDDDADRLSKVELRKRKAKQAEKKAAQQAAKAANAGKGNPKRDQAAQRRLQQRMNRLIADIDEIQSKTASSGNVVMGVRESRTPDDCRINIRGEVRDLGDEVPRGYVRVLTYPSSPDVNRQQSGRLQLAMWLTNKNNPLTARVMANRVWYHLFGRGIVETVDNFGALGEQPANPELLDYLAVRLVEHDWSVKKLIREIALSRAYRMSSDHSDANFAADPDNKLVWRMNRRRLEAEAIRDAILAVSGQLDLERPEGSLVQTLAGGEIGRRANTDGLTKDVVYRSAYLPAVRGFVHDFLSLFDVADPELVTGQRDVTTVAPQALYLMNSPFVLEQAEKAAKRLLEKSDLADDAARVDYAFLLAVSRPPTQQQQADALAFLNEYEASLPGDMKPAQRRLEAWTSLCQTLIASAEFRYVY